MKLLLLHSVNVHVISTTWRPPSIDIIVHKSNMHKISTTRLEPIPKNSPAQDLHCKIMTMLRRRLSSLATKPSWVRPGSYDYLREVLESRVYDVAIQTPLQLAPALTQSLPGNCRLFFKREVRALHVRYLYTY